MFLLLKGISLPKAVSTQRREYRRKEHTRTNISATVHTLLISLAESVHSWGKQVKHTKVLLGSNAHTAFLGRQQKGHALGNENFRQPINVFFLLLVPPMFNKTQESNIEIIDGFFWMTDKQHTGTRGGEKVNLPRVADNMPGFSRLYWTYNHGIITFSLDVFLVKLIEASFRAASFGRRDFFGRHYW